MSEDSTSLTFRGCHFSSKRNSLVDNDDKIINIRPKSLAVFKYLVTNSGSVVNKTELLDNVWQGVIVTDDSLGKCIREIRQAIDDIDRTTLRTVPGRGYILEPDIAPETYSDSPESMKAKSTGFLSRLLLPAAVVVGILVFWVGGNKSVTTVTDESFEADVGLASKNGTPTVSISLDKTTGGLEFLKLVENSVRVALSRYRSLVLLDSSNTDFEIRLSHNPLNNDPGIAFQLITGIGNEVIFAEDVSGEPKVHDEPSVDGQASQAKRLGVRIAGMVASPGGGAISRYLTDSAKNKNADELTRSECFAFGYDCTNCSGELDLITEKAQVCLAAILEEDPRDARAWGLQSTIYAHQYQWSTTLPEPQRTNLAARGHLPDLAIEAANKAEQFSDGTDTSVYWGMAQAYSSACEIEKLRTVVDRGLQINPDDPSLLGAFGSWIAYAGHWDDGIDMINRALEIEPRYYKRWWLFPLAKRHYANENYEEALKYFRLAFNERNWLSHLQLAYTLPHLGRIDEAIAARKVFESLYPGATIEKVLEFYKIYCFDDSYLKKLHWALEQAGLPSRSDIHDYNDIKPPSAMVKNVNGFDLEYIDIGSGVPIVFVHGSISDYRAWSHFQNSVSENYRFISYSRRYSGSQTWPDSGENYGIELDADDLVAFVETLDAGPVFTVSWSRGGRISGLAAIKRPDLFQGAVHFEPIAGDLGNSTRPLDVAARKAFFARFDDSKALFAEGEGEKAVAVILENVFELERGQFANEIMPLRMMNRETAKSMSLQVEKDADALPLVTCELLAKTSVPTLVIGGKETNAWWKHLVLRFSECVPGSELYWMDGVNHDGPMRKSEELTRLISEFVESHRQHVN